jgi:hypothetical protein
MGRFYGRVIARIRADSTAELTFVKRSRDAVDFLAGGGGTGCFVPAFFAQLPWRPSEGDIDWIGFERSGLAADETSPLK